MEKNVNFIEISTIFLIVLIGLIGNCLNFKVLTNKNVKKVTTFRYLSSLAVIDLVLLIVWFGYKLSTSGYLMIPKLYSKVIIKIISILLNFLSQISNWTFTALNMNKALSIINELKQKENKNKCNCIKIIISIIIILIILNLDNFIFFNFNPINQESTMIDPQLFNKTHQFVYQFIMKPKRNFTKPKIDLILQKTNLLKLNQKDEEIIVSNDENKDYDHIWFKIRTSIRLILFDLIPILINLTSTLIIWIFYMKLKDKKRIKFNRQFVLLFFSINSLFILDRSIKCISAFYFKFNEYQLESFMNNIIIQIFTISRHSFSFLIYIFTLKIYRDVILGLLDIKNNNTNENIPIMNLNLSKFLITSSKLMEIHLQIELDKRKSTIQYLSVDDFRLINLANDDNHRHPFRRRSKSLDMTWLV